MMIESGSVLIRLERGVKQEATQTLGHSDTSTLIMIIMIIIIIIIIIIILREQTKDLFISVYRSL